MPTKPWLTIAIPTFNRPELLRETLLRFIPQAIEHDVTIAISDNSEDERTAIMVAELAAVNPFIRYRKNETNVGFDRNVCLAVTMVETPYVWLFGDDDWPELGAIERIKHCIDINQPTVLVVNAVSMKPDMSAVVNPNISKQSESFSEFGPSRLFHDLVWYCAFIGAIIVRKEVWDSVDHQRYIGTGFIHTGVAFEATALPGARSAFISDPLVAYRSGAASWSKSFLELLLKGWPDTIALLPDFYGAMEKEEAALSAPTRFAGLAALANLRKHNFLSIAGFSEYVVPFWRRRMANRYALKTMAVCCGLLLIPPSVVGMMLNARKFVLRR